MDCNEFVEDIKHFSSDLIKLQNVKTDAERKLDKLSSDLASAEQNKLNAQKDIDSCNVEIAREKQNKINAEKNIQHTQEEIEAAEISKAKCLEELAAAQPRPSGYTGKRYAIPSSGPGHYRGPLTGEFISPEAKYAASHAALPETGLLPYRTGGRRTRRYKKMRSKKMRSKSRKMRR